MRLLTALTLLAVCGSVASDRPASPKNAKLKTKGLLKDSSGADIVFCTASDCDNGHLALHMERLYEVTSSGTQVPSKKASSFPSSVGTWSAGVSSSVNGSNFTTYMYTTTVSVSSVDVPFNLTAALYETSGTAENGRNQTVYIGAGGIKFAFSVGAWPFANAANKLRVGISVITKKRGDRQTSRNCTKLPGQGRGKNGRVDRWSMDDSTYLDAPDQASVDGIDTLIASDVDTTGAKTVLEWEFPSYTSSISYDPVIGSTDPTLAATDDTETTTVAPTTTMAQTTTAVPTTTASEAIVTSSSMFVAILSAFMLALN